MDELLLLAVNNSLKRFIVFATFLGSFTHYRSPMEWKQNLEFTQSHTQHGGAWCELLPLLPATDCQVCQVCSLVGLQPLINHLELIKSSRKSFFGECHENNKNPPPKLWLPSFSVWSHMDTDRKSGPLATPGRTNQRKS